MRTAYHVLLVLAASAIGCNPPVNPKTAPEAPSPAKAEPPAEAASQWSVTKSKNELDGKERITISNGELFIRCAPKFEGYVTPPLTNLGHRLETSVDRDQSVRYRIDAGRLTAGRWDISTTFDSLFIPNSTLLKIIHGKNKLIYEYQPEYVIPETTTVDLTGLEAAVKGAGCKI